LEAMNGHKVRAALAAAFGSAACVGVASVAVADSGGPLQPVPPAAAPAGMPAVAPAGGWMSAAGRRELVHLADRGVLPPNGTYVPLPSTPRLSGRIARSAAVPPPGFRCAIRAYPSYRIGHRGAYKVAATTKNVCTGVTEMQMASHLQEDTSRGWTNRHYSLVFQPFAGYQYDYLEAGCIFRRDWRARAYGTVVATSGVAYGGYNQSPTRRISC